MPIFDWLFKRQSKPGVSCVTLPANDAVPSRTSPRSEFIEIPSRRFFGEAVRSTNGRYTLAWRDANSTGTQGGARKSGRGRYLLLDGKQVISDGSIARPNDGRVANNGTFILNDWGLGEGLGGTFVACDRSGQRLITCRFKANLFNNGLSQDGTLAVCQTCNAYDSDDGSKLALFDLTNGKELGRWIPESGWADSYSFPRPGVIQLEYTKLGVFCYSWSGEFLDRENWQDARLTRGDYGSAMGMVEEILKSDSDVQPAAVLRFFRCLDRIEKSIPMSDSKTRARARKLRGQCFECEANFEEALRCYQEALALDPRVGAKRRVDQLIKQLQK